MCAICLVDFDEDCYVTPLPCHITHYFHSDCIEVWIMTRTVCPLCKKEVTYHGI
ncbi:MAG: RING finger domain-containing protein [bacterium]